VEAARPPRHEEDLMSESPSDGLQDQERTHPEDPSEGASTDQAAEPNTPRVHSEDPAEGPDDESAVS
jgi:hypothetical protein